MCNSIGKTGQQATRKATEDMLLREEIINLEPLDYSSEGLGADWG